MELIIEHKEKENKKVKGKMMKKVLIALLVVFLLVGTSVLSIYVIHSSTISSKPDTSDWVLENDKFAVVTAIDDTVSFHVENKQGEIVYKCSEEWRAWDFKTINIDNNNTITVVTGDMGEQEFRYNGETWIEK